MIRGKAARIFPGRDALIRLVGAVPKDHAVTALTRLRHTRHQGRSAHQIAGRNCDQFAADFRPGHPDRSATASGSRYCCAERQFPTLFSCPSILSDA